MEWLFNHGMGLFEGGYMWGLCGPKRNLVLHKGPC